MNINDIRLINSLIQKRINIAFKSVIGLKGDKGDKGDPFEYEDFTPEQLLALKGEPGITPVKGVDYFDGEDGAPGNDGYTPIKGVDYFDGDQGIPGNDGYTPIKGVDYFDGLPGQDGSDGEDGYTPVKGVDYFDGEKGDKGDPGDPGSDATVTKSAVEAVLTGEIISHSHASSGGLSQAQILTRQL